MHSRIYRATLGLIALAATLALATAAYAQGSRPRGTSTTKRGQTSPNKRTEGFMLGVHTIGAGGITLGGGAFQEPFQTNFGTGAGLMVGYGFNRTFSSYVSLDIAKQGVRVAEGTTGSFGLGHMEIGARANLPVTGPTWRKTVPYVSGSFGRRRVGARAVDDEGDQADLVFQGTMLGLGVGLEHFFSPTLSFDGGVQLGFGKFDQITVDKREEKIPGVTGSTTMRLRLGVTWRPSL